MMIKKKLRGAREAGLAPCGSPAAACVLCAKIKTPTSSGAEEAPKQQFHGLALSVAPVCFVMVPVLVHWRAGSAWCARARLRGGNVVCARPRVCAEKRACGRKGNKRKERKKARGRNSTRCMSCLTAAGFCFRSGVRWCWVLFRLDLPFYFCIYPFFCAASIITDTKQPNAEALSSFSLCFFPYLSP